MPIDWEKIRKKLGRLEDLVAKDQVQPETEKVKEADYWQHKLSEEKELWHKKAELLKEKKDLDSRVIQQELELKELLWKLGELETRWEERKRLHDEKLRIKEEEISDLKNRLAAQESEYKSKYFLKDAEFQVLSERFEAEKKKFDRVITEKESRIDKIDRLLAETGTREAVLEAKYNGEKLELARKLMEKEKEFTALSLKMVSEENRLKQDYEARLRKLEKESGEFKTEVLNQKKDAVLDARRLHAREIEAITKGFAHRLRNYLGILSSTVQFIAKQYSLTKAVRKQLDLLKRNIDLLNETSEEFIDTACISDLHLSEVDAAKLIKEAVYVIEGKCKKQGIIVNSTVPSEKLIVNADEKYLKEALLSVLANAIEALPEGGNIEIYAGRDSASGLAVFEVSNDGGVIPEETGERMYEPYFTNKKGHRGLGLSKARRITELHKGKITHQNIPPKVVKFRIYI